jgi:hypothetical protein
MPHAPASHSWSTDAADRQVTEQRPILEIPRLMASHHDTVSLFMRSQCGERS